MSCLERCLLVACALVAVSVAVYAETDPAPKSAKDYGETYTEWFYQGELEKLYELFSSDMQAALPLDSLRAFREQAVSQLGVEKELLDESVTERDGFDVYLRTARFEKFDGAIHVVWSIDAEGIVSGFYVRPAPQLHKSSFLDYETKTELRLPFDGEWTVFWGGRTVEQNYHAQVRDQRFAYDLVVTKDDKTHEGDGKRNEQYFCFGKPVLAPAAGVVVAAEDGVPDNVPQEMNADRPLGNHVIIDHGGGEFSFLAHFKNGSLQTEKGSRVGAGDVLGLCGNSGNSSEAHLHYHLQNSQEFGNGDGLPAPFSAYVADGQPVERGEPVRGQKIKPQ
ncbi:MAG: peptidoglycan DD-metalloendopeptidase family protein [Acidobacteriota bacterium]|nr:peptidoglycan DD-metalloendopeptidase family protein [Acidobacteriota bacterium]